MTDSAYHIFSLRFLFSLAPFPPLEAALKLVHAFGECGTQYQSLVTDGVFPSILQAVHQVLPTSTPLTFAERNPSPSQSYGLDGLL